MNIAIIAAKTLTSKRMTMVDGAAMMMVQISFIDV